MNLLLGCSKVPSADEGSVLSADYRCKTFDASANGFVRAEGVGTVILKRVDDALRDGDNILAIVRGSAIGNNGAGGSFGTPNAAAQELVFRAALLNAGVSPNKVRQDFSFLVAHQFPSDRWS